MLLRQVTDPHLAQNAYLIGCQQIGEAILVDPERDVTRYLALAAEHGLRITGVAETHVHADFLSGARELAAASDDVTPYLSACGGEEWQPQWAREDPKTCWLRDGDVFHVGRIRLQARHTPGHTPEHLVFLVTDEGAGANQPMLALTGDFLFVGDVGRPDLLETVAGHTGSQERAARQLYRSLRAFALANADGLQLLPGHGAGSACGKSLGAVPSTTLGYERHFNGALVRALAGDEESFVHEILAGQPEPPVYFARMKALNCQNPPLLGPAGPVPELTAGRFEQLLGGIGTVVLDTRSRRLDYLRGHLKGSLYAPAEGSFSEFVGSYLEPDTTVLLVVNHDAAVPDLAAQLYRLGFDRVAGYLRAENLPGLALTRQQPMRTVRFADVPTLLASSAPPLPLDVRRAPEFQQAHLRGARHIAHTRLRAHLDELPPGQPLLVYCASGNRASAASAFLEQQGREVILVDDAFANAPDGLRATNA